MAVLHCVRLGNRYGVLHPLRLRYIYGEVTERVKTLHGIAHNYGDLIGACLTQRLTIYLHFG